MRISDGHLLIPGHELPSFAEVQAISIAAAGRAKAEGVSSNKSYLKPVLTDHDFLASPALFRFCLAESLLDSVASYLSERPILRSVQVYLTERNDTSLGSQQWHFDHIETSQIKMFVNMLPMEEPNGPFTFVPKSVSDTFLRSTGLTWETAHKRKFDDADLAGIEASAIRIAGPAGTAAMVDTSNCLHLGGRTREGERIMLIAQYTRRSAFDPKRRPPVPPAETLTASQRAALLLH
ncbi:MAG TPA: hypothetical protein VHG92_08020 [Afifellaceae bacterium]|nr:hypothetical protein [Afifellaceae bacterium]